MITVYDSLEELGFVEEESSYGLRMRIRFAFVDMNAILGLRPDGYYGVQFSGAFSSQRSFGEIDFSLPESVESLNLLKAYIAYYLDTPWNEMRGRPDVPQWLVEGKEYEDLLPWKKNLKDYETRDACMVERDWLKLAIKTLRTKITGFLDDELVEVHFDGEMLRFSLPSEVVPVSAGGEPWKQSYRLMVKSLRWLPKRLMRDPVCVDVIDGFLNIDRSALRLVSEADLQVWRNCRECRCQNEDVKVAQQALLNCDQVGSMVGDSHFSAGIIKCEACGQQFLSVFAELIDWDDGDDSQASLWLPVFSAEARKLLQTEGLATERLIMEMKMQRRYLVNAKSKGNEAYATWYEGPFFVPPHD